MTAPKIVKFRDLENLDNAKFKKELVDRLGKYDVENISYDTFHNIFMELTGKQLTKYFRFNHAPFMSKTLTKNISHRTKLRNKLNIPRYVTNLLIKPNATSVLNYLEERKGDIPRYVTNLLIKPNATSVLNYLEERKGDIPRYVTNLLIKPNATSVLNYLEERKGGTMTI